MKVLAPAVSYHCEAFVSYDLDSGAERVCVLTQGSVNQQLTSEVSALKDKFTGEFKEQAAVNKEQAQEISNQANQIKQLNISLKEQISDVWTGLSVAPSTAPTPANSCANYGPTICGANKFCVGFEQGKVYCYGYSTGCKWNSDDCNVDADCSKYSTSSAKYTDGDNQTCPVHPLHPGGSLWRADACSCTGQH